MRWVLATWAMLSIGCYAAAGPSDAGARWDAARPPPRGRRVCTSAADCFPDEACRRFLVAHTESVCALPCAPESELCEDGSFCLSGYCFPGAPAGGDGTCLSVLDCPFGTACRNIGLGTRGECTNELCAADVECGSGTACVGRTCTRVCHPLDDTCPEGFVCYAGQCRIEAQVRECEPEGIVDYGCGEGQVCWGSNARWVCVTPEEVPPLTRCLDNEAWLNTRRFQHQYTGCYSRGE